MTTLIVLGSLLVVSLPVLLALSLPEVPSRAQDHLLPGVLCRDRVSLYLWDRREERRSDDRIKAWEEATRKAWLERSRREREKWERLLARARVYLRSRQR